MAKASISLGLGFRVEGLRLRNEGLGFRGEGLRLRNEGLGFRVEGLGFRSTHLAKASISLGLGFRV